jgi:sortase (surface protein transpeptidase)
VSIPAIGVTSTLLPLLLDSAGALVPPPDFVHAGWYTGGPAPGEQGPAVIAGHVDSRTGPAIFFTLRDLTPGDLVTVTRSDRRTVRFRVTLVERYPKNAFPRLKVYQPTPDPTLRLITCGGSFDYAKRSYRDNIVVYAVSA